MDLLGYVFYWVLITFRIYREKIFNTIKIKIYINVEYPREYSSIKSSRLKAAILWHLEKRIYNIEESINCSGRLLFLDYMR